MPGRTSHRSRRDRSQPPRNNDAVATPYGQYVGDHDPVIVLERSLGEYRDVVSRVTPARWAEPWAPGKWTVAQVVLHVTQWEMIFGVRLRCAVSTPGYVVQPLDQDPFMRESEAVDGPTAFAAFEALRRMNVAYARSLSPVDRSRKVEHRERGTIDVESLLVTLAGHPVHHLQQIRQ